MGDYDEAAKLCEAEAGRLVGYLGMRGANRHEAEDIAQDTFLVVCRKGQQVTSHPNPTAFLYKDREGDRPRSAAFRQLPVRQRDQVVPAGHAVERGAGNLGPRPRRRPEGAGQLSERQREVVYLHRCADMRLEDVAGVLDLALGSVKEHLRRAELRLRKLLGDDRRGGQAWRG